MLSPYRLASKYLLSPLRLADRIVLLLRVICYCTPTFCLLKKLPCGRLALSHYSSRVVAPTSRLLTIPVHRFYYYTIMFDKALVTSLLAVAASA